MGHQYTSSQPIRKLNKTAKVSYSVVLPKDIVRNLKWREGQKLVVTQDEDRVIIEDWKE